MGIQYNFERIEKKYLITEAQAQALTKALAPRMEEEKFGLHSVLNVYFDTPDFSLIRNSIEKPVYKEKFRLRCYGTPGENDIVYAEVKKKYKGVVYKRRISGMPAEIARFLQGKTLENQNELNQREIHFFLNRWQPEPRVFIAYDRFALLGREDAGLRITFDRNLRWRTHSLDLRCGDAGQLILPSDQVVMEIKMPASCPLWLSHLLSEMGIFPHSFSKYGTCYTNHLLPLTKERSFVTC